MSELSLHQAVCQGCGVTSLGGGSQESVGALLSLPPIPRRLTYRFLSVIIQEARMVEAGGSFLRLCLLWKNVSGHSGTWQLSMTGEWHARG